MISSYHNNPPLDYCMADRDKWTQEQFKLIPKNFWKNY